MRRRAHLFMAIAVSAILAVSLPAGADDTVSLGMRDIGSFPVVHGQEHPLVYKHGATYRMSVSVVGSNHDRVNRVRVLIGGIEVSGHAGRPTGPIDPGAGPGGRPRGVFYDLNVPMTVRDLCGAAEATAEAVYRDERVVRAASGKRIYIDCRPPTLRVESPTSGLCIKLGDGFSLRMTATDDAGIGNLVADFGRLGRYGPGPTVLNFPPPKTTVPFTYSILPQEHHGNGPVMVRVEATDWFGGKASTELSIVLDGKVPPTIGVNHPHNGQRFSTLEPITVEGPASDPGCGLDRVEIRARPAGTRDPFRVLMTVRTFPPEGGYRVTLPPGSLAPGRWDLNAAAFARTRRPWGDVWIGPEIEVFRPIGLRPLPPAPPRKP